MFRLLGKLRRRISGMQRLIGGSSSVFAIIPIFAEAIFDRVSSFQALLLPAWLAIISRGFSITELTYAAVGISSAIKGGKSEVPVSSSIIRHNKWNLPMSL
jgi:hypothetical protein